jgi:hypothetical protein
MTGSLPSRQIGELTREFSIRKVTRQGEALLKNAKREPFTGRLGF